MIRREALAAILFVTPATLLIAVFVLWPAVATFHTSLHKTALTDQGQGPFCGSDNYRDLFSDAEFARSARNTVLFTALVVPLQTVSALLLALWANGPGWSRRWLKFAVFLPTMLSLTVLSVVWKLLYEPSTATGAGLFNGLLTSVHLVPQPFLTSVRQAMPAIAAMSVWQGLGLQMMIFLSALQQVPKELTEAAFLDGAGRWRRFWSVTFPAIAPTGMFVVIVTTVFALKLFVQPFLMTRGGPQGSTISMVQYIYETAFYERDLGLACAAGAVFFTAVALLTLIQRRLSVATEAWQ